MPRLSPIDAVRYTLAVAALVLIAPSAGAQQLLCVDLDGASRSCAYAAAGRDTVVTFVLKATKAGGGSAANIPLVFRADSAKTIESTTTNAQGIAVAQWVRRPGGSFGNLIATAAIDGSALALPISVKPAVAPLAVKGTYNEPRGWFVERQMPGAVGLELEAATPAACGATKVKFRPLSEGSVVAPDTVSGEWWPARRYERDVAWNRDRCLALTRWRLGKEVGEQFLRADVLGAPNDSTRTMTAIARGLPRVMASVLFSYQPTHQRLESASRTVRVKPIINGVPMEYDSTVSTGAEIKNAQFSAVPVLALDFPVLLKWQRIRAIVGTSLTGSNDTFVLGLSGLQLFTRDVQREAVPFDVHLVAVASRMERITNLADCRDAVANCRTSRSWLLSGAGLMMSIDGVSLLDQLLKTFPKV